MLLPNKIKPILFLLLVTVGVRAQSVAPDQTTNKPQDKEAIAFALLEKVIAESASLSLAENRLRLWLSAADLLWARDEKRARTLAAQAMAEYTNVITEIKSQWAQKKDWDEMSETAKTDDLRQELVSVLAKHDPALAEEFLASTRPPRTINNSDQDFSWRQTEQKLQKVLFMHAAQKQPSFAAEKGSEVLAADGFQDFTHIVAEMMASDKNAAANLAKAMADSYKNFPARFSYEHFATIENLFRVCSGANQIVLGAPIEKTFSLQKNAPRLPEKDLRQIVEIMGAVALEKVKGDALSFSTADIFSMPEVFQQVEKYAPALAEQIKKQTAQNLRKAAPEAQQQFAKQQNMPRQIDTVESLLASAKTASANAAKRYQLQAADLALQNGDLARSRQILQANFSEDDLDSARLWAEIDTRELKTAVQKIDIAMARKLAEEKYSTSEKISYLAELATNLSAAGKSKQALDLLQELRQELGTSVKTQLQIESQLNVAKAFAPVDTAQAAAIIEVTIPRVNELIGAMAALEGVQPQPLFRKSELTYYYSPSPVSQLFTAQIDALAVLAKRDAARAISMLELYQYNEIKNLARLTICQKFLTEK